MTAILAALTPLLTHALTAIVTALVTMTVTLNDQLARKAFTALAGAINRHYAVPPVVAKYDPSHGYEPASMTPPLSPYQNREEGEL